MHRIMIYILGILCGKMFTFSINNELNSNKKRRKLHNGLDEKQILI